MNQRTLIIAEAGVNHNGSLSLAKQLIDVAVEAHVDIVKFQTFKSEKMVTVNAQKAEYQRLTTGGDESQLLLLKKLELSEQDHDTLRNYCSERHIKFLSTPFDLDSIELVKKLGVDIGKVPSGEITNRPYLQAMAKSFPTLIVSTGMCTMQEIREALEVLMDSGAKRDMITILHCNTEYPTPFDDVNLMAMLSIQDEFQVKIGYSDHTPGIEVAIAAVALGASVIEKHFTLDRTMPGPDHKASLEPDELIQMTKSIRNIESALGNGKKEPSPSEKKNRAVARKSLVASAHLVAGVILGREHISIKRPGSGLSPMTIESWIGKRLIKEIMQDELFTADHFEK